MAHVIETPRLGDWVTIHVEPGCEREFIPHGIAPLVNGLRGQIVGIDHHEGDHCVWVAVSCGDDRHRMWLTYGVSILTESVEALIADPQTVDMTA